MEFIYISDQMYPIWTINIFIDCYKANEILGHQESCKNANIFFFSYKTVSDVLFGEDSVAVC